MAKITGKNVGATYQIGVGTPVEITKIIDIDIAGGTNPTVRVTDRSQSAQERITSGVNDYGQITVNVYYDDELDQYETLAAIRAAGTKVTLDITYSDGYHYTGDAYLVSDNPGTIGEGEVTIAYVFDTTGEWTAGAH